MAGAGLVPQAIVLALGPGALGGLDALRLLLQFVGRISPAVDVAISVAVISFLTTPLLGTVLLARFVCKARPGVGDGVAPAATDLFAQVTATVFVGAAFLVTACLLVVPVDGAARLPIDFAVRNPVVVTAFAFAAAAAAVPLQARFFPGASSAGGPAPAAPPATTVKVMVFVVAVSFLVASDGFDAHAHAHRRRSMVTLPVGVAIVTVAGTTLLVRCSRRARNAAGASGGVAARTS